MTTTIPMLDRARDLHDTLIEWRRGTAPQSTLLPGP